MSDQAPGKIARTGRYERMIFRRISWKQWQTGYCFVLVVRFEFAAELVKHIVLLHFLQHLSHHQHPGRSLEVAPEIRTAFISYTIGLYTNHIRFPTSLRCVGTYGRSSQNATMTLQRLNHVKKRSWHIATKRNFFS